MNLQGGIPYKDMLKRLFPLLRRIEFVVEYRIRALNAEEASEMIYIHPDLLSLEEMYSVARYYRPGTEQYREVYEVAGIPFPGRCDNERQRGLRRNADRRFEIGMGISPQSRSRPACLE